MTPSELRGRLNHGIDTLKTELLKGITSGIVKFDGVYSNYYIIFDDDKFICLCAEGYGYLTKANPKRSTAKIARLFYVDMTEKVCQ